MRLRIINFNLIINFVSKICAFIEITFKVKRMNFFMKICKLYNNSRNLNDYEYSCIMIISNINNQSIIKDKF